MKQIQDKTVSTTMSLLRWIFLIILIYVVLTMLWGFWDRGGEYIRDIATLSIGGFFAFFLGYFGWRLGQELEEWLKRRL